MSLQTFDEVIPLAIRITADDSYSTVLFGMGPIPAYAHRIDYVYVTNNDTIDHVVDVHYVVLSNPTLLGSCNVPAGSGLAGVPPVDVLAGVLGAPGLGLAFAAASNIDLSVEVAIVPTFTMTVVALGGYF